MRRNRCIALAVLGTSWAMMASARADVEVENFHSPFTLDATYGSWGAPFTTLTSNPTDWEVQSQHYGSGYKYLGPPIDGTGYDTVQVNVTVNSGVAGVLIDLTDSTNNGESYRFYGLTPGNGTNGTNNYTLTEPLASGTYFYGTGVLNIADITQMNIEIDPGPSTAPYDVLFNDVSLIKAPVTSVTSTWNASSPGSWNTSTNWLSSIPNGSGATAILGPVLGSSGSITLDASQTVGHLVFNNSSSSYTVAAGTGGSLTIDNSAAGSSGSPDITVLSGSHVIAAPLVLAGGAIVNTSSGSILTVSGTVTGNGPLTVQGGGTFDVAASGSLSNTIALNVSGGTMKFDAGSAGVLNRSIGALSIGSGGVVSLANAAVHSNRTLLVVTGLSIAGAAGAYTGKLDLTNNDLQLPGASLATVTQYVAGGYNAAGGSWTGNGITSSAAAADSKHLTALGVIQNNQGGNALYTAANPFDGTTPGVSDVLVKYTYYGDANLDGRVDGSDYSRIDSAYLTNQSAPNSLSGWYNGDFNYDGVINGSDYTLIDNAFNSQGASLSVQTATASATALISPANASSVPEPTGVACVGILTASLLRRRRPALN
jgi:hypothetical protein